MHLSRRRALRAATAVPLAAALALSAGGAVSAAAPADAGKASPTGRPAAVQPPGSFGADGTRPSTTAGWQPVQATPRLPLVSRDSIDWTVVDPTFAPLTGAGGAASTRVLSGVDAGAGYRIEVPLSGWNGDVVFYEHGYRGTGTRLTVDSPPFGLREHYIAKGYAWAASSYSANRYDIEAGARSTESLAKLFDRLVAPADRRYLQGVSMGGHVIGALLERQRGVQWDGAAPMCGVMGDQELFDFFLSYNLAAQALAGVDAYPIPADYLRNAIPRIKVTLGLPGSGRALTQDGAELRALITELTGGPRPGDDAAFTFWEGQTFVLGLLGSTPGGLDGVTPGSLATNATTDYPDVATVGTRPLDQVIERVAPAHQARRTGPSAYVPDIQGTFKVPVLSIHTLGDYFVPFSMEQAYARDVAANGDPDLLVQRAIRAAGHCEFTPAEATAQFDDLVGWVERGVKPAGDDVRTRAVVAGATYGCAFTSASRAGTRAYYPPCA